MWVLYVCVLVAAATLGGAHDAASLDRLGDGIVEVVEPMVANSRGEFAL